jgi:hypothetical protein
MDDFSTRRKELFWAKVNKAEGCWEWTAARVHNGYGVFNLAGNRQQVAHKYSYRLHVGEVQDGLDIDHTCHNRACVNPDHLRAITHKQNQENRTGAQVNSKSGVRGVVWHEQGRKWQATVKHNKKRVYVGLFADLADAESAVIAKRNELFTHNDLDRAA